jgi:hypothetical protein
LLSRDAFDAFGSRKAVWFSPRIDITYPQNSFRDRANALLRQTDMQLTAFDLTVPPKFFESIKRPLVKWVATSTSSQTIPELLRIFEEESQIHLHHRNHPTKIAPPSGTYHGAIVVEILSQDEGKPGLSIVFSINQENIAEPYKTPIKLEEPGEYVIRSKVVGGALLDSCMVFKKFSIVTPPSNKGVEIIIRILASFVMLVFIICIARFALKIHRALAERRRQSISDRITDEQLVINAFDSTSSLDFPMVLMRADIFCALPSLPAFETLSEDTSLVFLHSFPQVADFQLCRKIVLLSHQWLGHCMPDPDNVQFHVMKNAVGQAVKILGMRSSKVYVWVDYLCVPQLDKRLQSMAIRSIVSYCSCCDLFIAIAPECTHSDSNLLCNEATYNACGWCRAERFAKIMTTGSENMFIARSDRDSLEEFTNTSALDVFDGDFTCCRLNHREMSRCDKEQLQYPLLGLYAKLLAFPGSIGIATSDQELRDVVLTEADSLFPKTFQFSIVKDMVVVTEARALFGNRLMVCQEQLRRPQNLLRLSIEDRKKPRPIKRVPGKYKMLSHAPVHATRELEEQNVAPQLLSRGSTVKILSVEDASMDNVIIGMVENPPGWIRLFTTEGKVRWVEKIDTVIAI